MRNPAFCIYENKDATAKLISAFVFATRIVQSLYYLNPKVQASRHIQWLYSPVCVRPVGNPDAALVLCGVASILEADTLSTPGAHFKYEPRCEKTGLRGFRPGPTQTRL